MTRESPPESTHKSQADAQARKGELSGAWEECEDTPGEGRNLAGMRRSALCAGHGAPNARALKHARLAVHHLMATLASRCSFRPMLFHRALFPVADTCVLSGRHWSEFLITGDIRYAKHALATIGGSGRGGVKMFGTVLINAPCDMPFAVVV